MTSFLFPLTYVHFSCSFSVAHHGASQKTSSIEVCMLLDRQNRLVEDVLNLKPRPRRALLEGKITLSEAQELSQLSRGKSKGMDALIDRLHMKRHKGINDKVEIVEDLGQMLVSELDRMPDHVAMKFMSGSITLLQARQATQEKHGRRKLARTHRTNRQIAIPKRFSPSVQMLGTPKTPSRTHR